MGKIIAFANQKGGVGKTTTCINMSAYLTAMGKKVLAVDLDPQGNTTSGLGIEKSKLSKSIYNALMGDCSIDDVIAPTGVDNLDIIPSNIDLAGAEVEMVYMEQREKLLQGVLNKLKNTYDYICIDCPPSLGLLTINALTACDSVIIPIQSEFFALEGLSQLMNTIKLVKKHLNPTIEIDGVLLTMFDGRSNLVNSVADEIYKYFGNKVFEVKIPRNVRLGEAPSYGLPIMQYDPKSSGALSYQAFTEEYLTRNNDTFIKIDDPSILKKRY
ncbi:MAG TPA: AAA family ATPase [Clostridia bacterium]|jgi:chromosome partitioning protein